jgi:hypothetical protein
MLDVIYDSTVNNTKLKLNTVALVRKWTIPIEFACWWSQCQLSRTEGVAWSAQRIPMAVNLSFLDQSHYFSIQVAPQLSSRGWVDPVPDPLFLRKSGSTGNRTQNLWMCSQELWPLDHRGSLINNIVYVMLSNRWKLTLGKQSKRKWNGFNWLWWWTLVNTDMNQLSTYLAKGRGPSVC